MTDGGVGNLAFKEDLDMFNKKLLILVSLILIVSVAGGWALTAERNQEPRLIPLTDFFKNPVMTHVTLSPNGEHIAFMMPWERRLNVFIRQVGENKASRITHAQERDIAGYAWANNRRIVYVQDSGGDENFRLYAVDIDGSNFKELTPFENVQVRIVDRLEDIEDQMLISMNKRDERIFDVYRININTGKMKMAAENPGNISGWLTDNNGRLRVAVATDGVNTTLLYRQTEAGSFRPIVTTHFKDSIDPLYFTFDNNHLYVASNIGRDKKAIFKYDVETGKHLELIYEHPQVDVIGMLRSKKRKVLTGVSYITDKLHYHFTDRPRKQLQDILESKLPGDEVVVTSMSKDETRVLIRTYSDTSMGAYYYYDLTGGQFQKLADVSPWLDEGQMAGMQPVQFRSRDGLTLHGYLTLPKGVKAKNLPIIVKPHGGPWARDVWGFNPEVQFLANRGIGVLQVNFRGSTGYGKAFWEAGFKQWGRRMQNDITDGARWLIGRGIADPKRIGIYGASYGGYAVLAGLAFTPDLYACGVDYVGVSNLFTLLDSLPSYWELGREMMYEMIGDPVKDKELLTAISPVFHADKFKVPLLVAQGANDPRVKKAESDQIVQALEKRGIDVQYIVKDNEGHGFANEENRFEFYRTMEIFLGKHLGSKVENRAA
jgi:dipeptidyl aminopeptidase/acylaminoacyl peptidase